MKHTIFENKMKIDEVLRGVSFIGTVDSFPMQKIGNHEIDYTVHVELTNGEQYVLNIEFMNEAYPALVKTKLAWLNRQFSDKYFLIAAPYVSEKTKNLCMAEGVGFIDYAGNCLIDYKNLHISISGNRNLSVKKRGAKSIFERSSVVSSNILRLLLRDTKQYWKLQEISSYLKCSIGQVYKVKDFLHKNAWIEFGSEGIIITDVNAIMHKWADVYNMKENSTFECYSLDSPAVIEKKLKNFNSETYFLSGFSGGVRYSSSVRYSKVHVYITDAINGDVLSKLNLKKVASGANVSVIAPYDECVLFDNRIVNGVKVVSPVQAYLDCANLKGRGQELSEQILNKEIDR